METLCLASSLLFFVFCTTSFVYKKDSAYRFAMASLNATVVWGTSAISALDFNEGGP